ncbi:nuclease, partial [Cronobacter dublinensis subsp. dublinensis]|nr:nuclease [Cronobacter dublinensis subsp. dublinensis]
FGKLTIAQIGKAYEEAGLSARAGEIVKLKRRDAAKAAEQDLNAQGWLPDWMVRPAPAAEAEEATESDADTTDHAA